MKNKILIGIGTFVAILAVIGILAFSFTMTPVAATNITNATEFINITCTTAILLNDSNINGGSGGVLQSCIDLYTNQSAAVVSSKNETNQCWSGASTFDYIKLLNKGNNWLRIDLNLTEDAGFIGQTGGSQFANIANILYVQVRNGNTYGGAISNDVTAACLNVTAFNETILQKGVTTTMCGALAWETTRNDLLLFKKWFIQPKTAPGGYNFTETISATQVQCTGSDPTLSPGYGNITSMLAGTGTNNQLDVMSSIYGSDASPTMLITTPTVTTPSPVSSIDFLANAPNANLPAGTAAIGIYNNFNTAASTNSVFTVASATTSTKTVSGLPGPNANFTNAQVAFSGDGSVMYIVMTQTAAPIGTLYKCTLNATGYNYAATDSLSTVTGDAIQWVGGYTNIGNFDPTSSAAYYALLYNTTLATRKLAIIKDDGSTRSLIIKYDITGSFLDPSNVPRDIAVDTEYNVMYALISTGTFGGQVVQMPLGRTGNTISSVGLMNPFADTNIAPNTAAGVGTRQMGTVPTLVFPNAY